MPDTLFRWFFEAALKYPDEIAVETADRSVTYARLDRLSLVAASALHAVDLPPHTRVGLLARRTVQTYAAYLAILRLGHTVVPMAPDFPVARNVLVAQSSKMSVAILGAAPPAALADGLAAHGVTVLADADGTAGVLDWGGVDDSDPDTSAYALFTSGSTGRPKGVLIGNRQACAYLRHVTASSDLGPGSRVSHTFALTFDPSIFDLFATWGTGATLVVPQHKELLLPAAYSRNRRLTHWYSVPSLISYARRTGSLTPGSMPGLRRSMFIGEPLSLPQAVAWRAAAEHSSIENVYGPVELTVSCSAYRLPDDMASWPDPGNGTVPIGAVYPHLDWLLVDSSGGQSDEGELVVRGPQRFDGYLDPGDNRGRFLRMGPGGQATPVGGGILPSDYYRTGDRVALRDGCLVHLGRIDRQVKIGGHRVELAEVEAALRSHRDVMDVGVVAVRATAAGRVVIVAVLSPTIATDRQLTEHLTSRLPLYMVPERFLRLAEMPANGSGKIDYSAITPAAERLINAR